MQSPWLAISSWHLVKNLLELHQALANRVIGAIFRGGLEHAENGLDVRCPPDHCSHTSCQHQQQI